MSIRQRNPAGFGVLVDVSSNREMLEKKLAKM
jgi:hypothetical protein